MSTVPSCIGHTAATGRRCDRPAVEGTQYCARHLAGRRRSTAAIKPLLPASVGRQFRLATLEMVNRVVEAIDAESTSYESRWLRFIDWLGREIASAERKAS